MTILGWMVLDLTGSPWLVALVGTCGFAPTLLLGAVGGLLADRVDRKRLLISTQTVNLIVTIGMTIMLFTDQIQFWHAYVVIFMNGTGAALDFPSRRSVVHDLMGRAGVTNALAMESVGMHTSRMIGPALAGVLITTVDVSGAYLAINAFHVATVALTNFLQLPQRSSHSDGVKAQGYFKVLSEGFSYVAHQRTILAAVLITILMNLLFFPYQQMMPVIAKTVLHVGPTLMGLLMASEGFGALLGAIGIASATNITHHGRFFLGGSVLALSTVLLFAASESYNVALPLLVIMGLGTSGFGTMQGTIVVLVAKDEMRGRSLGVMSLAIGASPLGALLIGGLADLFGPTRAIGMMGATGVVCVLGVGLLMPSLRQKTVPDQ